MKNAHILIGAQSNDHSTHLSGVPSRRFYTDAAIFARVQLLVTAYYGFNVPSNFWDVYNVEAEALGQKVIYPERGIPDIDRREMLVAQPSDLNRLVPPDPYASGRMPWVLQVNRHFQEMTGRLERSYFTAPFSLAVNVRGYENLVQDIYLRPDFVHRLLEFLCDQVLVPFLEAVRREAGIPDLILDGRDAWASPPLITLDMMDEYVVAYTERLRARLGPPVITRGNWGDAKCRDPERFFAQKLRCSPGGLSVLDPDLFALGARRIKEFAHAHAAAVTAGIDAKLLQDGPAAAVVERVRHYIDLLGRDGRCMLHLNQIPADTPPAHIHAAVAACRAFGRLPVSADLSEVDFRPPEREGFDDFLRERGERLDA
jgi:uroporphyrinogen-III decarboxylase